MAEVMILKGGASAVNNPIKIQQIEANVKELQYSFSAISDFNSQLNIFNNNRSELSFYSE